MVVCQPEIATVAPASSPSPDRGREGHCPPRPPNRTCGFPAYGSPVGGFLIGDVSLPAKPGTGRTAPTVAKKVSGPRPSSPFDAVAQRRHHGLRPHRSFRPPSASTVGSGFCTAFSLSGTAGAVCASLSSSSIHLPAPLPSARFCCPRLSDRLLDGHRGSMRALTPGALAQPDRSLRLPRFAVRTSRPQPHNTHPERRFHSHLSASGRAVTGPGFASGEQARRYAMPKRVRHPTGYPFASGCSPPRLAATQLPSASYAVTTHGKDFHLADKASSRTHSPRALGAPERARTPAPAAEPGERSDDPGSRAAAPRRGPGPRLSLRSARGDTGTRKVPPLVPAHRLSPRTARSGDPGSRAEDFRPIRCRLGNVLDMFMALRYPSPRHRGGRHAVPIQDRPPPRHDPARRSTAA